MIYLRVRLHSLKAFLTGLLFGQFIILHYFKIQNDTRILFVEYLKKIIETK